MQAALTGHLVLSTLHTKNALETIERLMNIGISDFDIASSVDCVIAQRLVRRVCPHCSASIDLGFTPDTKLLGRYSDQPSHPQK